MPRIRYLVSGGLLIASVASAQPAVTGVVSPARSPRNASYSIDAQLDPATRTITGSEVIAWRNVTTRTASDLQFHLYWNAWRNDRSTWLREAALGGSTYTDRRDDERGRIDVTSIVLLTLESPGTVSIKPDTAAGSRTDLTAARQFIAPDDGNRDDETVMSGAAAATGRARRRCVVGSEVDRSRPPHLRPDGRDRSVLLHRAVVPEARRPPGRGVELPPVSRRHRVLLRLRRLRRQADHSEQHGRWAPLASSGSGATTPAARRRTGTTRKTFTTSPGRRARTTSYERRALSTRRFRRSICVCCCSRNTPDKRSVISTRRARRSSTTESGSARTRTGTSPSSIPHTRAARTGWSIRHCSRPARAGSWRRAS